MEIDPRPAPGGGTRPAGSRMMVPKQRPVSSAVGLDSRIDPMDPPKPARRNLMNQNRPDTARALCGKRLAITALAGLVFFFCFEGSRPGWAQAPVPWKIHDMNRPRPPKVKPAVELPATAPSDAVVLFGGSDVSKWRSRDGGPAGWIVKDGYMESVRGSGYVFTRDSFGDVQLHVEWAAPVPAAGKGQGRGNSGVFLMGLYEVQVLDSDTNVTYTDGQAAAIYGQHPPLTNASLPAGEWQAYDIVFRRPLFRPDGSVVKPARITVLHNGVLVQDNVEIWGPTSWLRYHPYESHPDKLPLSLQDHGNPVRYRNIWVRELPESTATGPATGDAQPLLPLAPQVLDRYTGKYRLGNMGVTIFREGTQMFAQVADSVKLELLTRSPQEFSLRWTAGRFVFELNPEGAPTALTFHIGGDELQGKKVE
jgi:hypothetical protein